MKIKSTSKFYWYTCATIIFIFLYWIIGCSLISNPGFLLTRNAGYEGLAKKVLVCKNSQANTPRVYLLPKNILRLFYLPYAYTSNAYISKRFGLQNNDTSFSDPEDGFIVIQQNATLEDFYHELGHIADYSNDPETYTKKSLLEKEMFAVDFAHDAWDKCGH